MTHLPFVKNTASTLGNTISRLSGGKISAAEATTMALDKGKDITLDIADVVKTGAEQGQSLQEMAEELFVRQMQTLGMESLFSGATRVTISETLDGNLGILKKFAGDGDVADDVSDAARAAKQDKGTVLLSCGRFETSKTNQGESYAKGEAFGYFVNALAGGAVIGRLPFGRA